MMKETGSWVWDVERGAPVYWSAAMYRIHGLDAAEGPPSIDDWRALHRPDDWSDWLAAIQRAAEECSDLNRDTRVIMPDGAVRTVRLTGRAIRGAAGVVTEIVGSAHELSVDPTAPVPPAPKEDPFRRMIDRIPALVWTSTPNGSAEFFNRAWLDYTGLPEHEALGWGWTAVLHPDDLDGLVIYWQSILTARTAGQIEARFRRSDGEFRWFLLRAHPRCDETGNVVQWYGTNTDIQDLKRAESALREGERQLRDLVEAIPAHVWRGTPGGNLDYLNQRHMDYLGKTLGDLSEGAWLDLVHPDHRKATVARWRQSVASGSSYEDVYRIRRADGQYRWVESVGEPLHDSDGRIVHWYGVIVDIDDRKRTEDAYRESARDLRLLVDSVPGVIAVANAEGQHEYANRRALDYTGTTIEDLSGLGFIGTIHPDDQEMVVTAWLRSNALAVPMDLDHRWRRFDGVYRWFHARVDPLLDDQGKVVRWYGLLTDIEDQRNVEAALRASEHHLRLLVETIPALVCRTRRRGELEYVNQRVVNYLGDTAAGIDLDVIHPDDREEYQRKLLHSFETGEAWDCTYRIRRADGAYRWFRASVAPMHDHHGEVVNWYAVNLDIHDSKELEEALQSTRRRLATAAQMATVAELSASIAHEINQPLASIVTNGHACQAWLSHDPPNLERALATVERIIRDGHSAAEVVRKIRALFRQSTPAKALLNVNEIVNEVLTLIVDELRDHTIVVETDLMADPQPIPADRVQIQTLLVNLVHNAVEAMDGVDDSQKRLVIESRRDATEMVIRVRDQGCGVANSAAIYEPFFTTKEAGMGMGLSICRSIVEAHGGRLWATPNEDAGTTFTVALPLDPPAAL